ncbi:gas vesicle protein GvpJ [Halogranum rubrum]|uniref:Gas vesicle protein GVPa n=1 Tax=Halogranum salarium B-1 TaxID=1210908 RepID=J3EYC9_9EURY|nr:gas vesicle protein GVPa [Halogranum salarium B-1]
MTNGTAPTRQKDSLADVVEMLLDKGVVINADIAVTVGETELLGIKLRAAIASFETAAQYGLEFPEGTDMERVEAASGRGEIGKPPERGLTVRAGATDPDEPADEEMAADETSEVVAADASEDTADEESTAETESANASADDDN